jgi:hypothetical protein
LIDWFLPWLIFEIHAWVIEQPEVTKVQHENVIGWAMAIAEEWSAIEKKVSKTTATCRVSETLNRCQKVIVTVVVGASSYRKGRLLTVYCGVFPLGVKYR